MNKSLKGLKKKAINLFHLNSGMIYFSECKFILSSKFVFLFCYFLWNDCLLMFYELIHLLWYTFVQKPIILADLYRDIQYSQLIGLSGYSREVIIPCKTLYCDKFYSANKHRSSPSKF